MNDPLAQAMSPAPAAVTVPAPDWAEANQRYLAAALDLLHARLAARLAVARSGEVEQVDQAAAGGAAQEEIALAELEAARALLPGPAAIDTVCAAFGLTAFECDLLLLCAGCELDARFAPLCGQLHGDPLRPYPTFGLALAVLTGAHWSALLPDAPLRHWRLLELCPGGSPAAALTTSPLRADERIVHELCGAPHLDERLAALVTPVYLAAAIAPAHAALADRLAAHWSQPAWDAGWPPVQLCGASPAEKRAIAAEACDVLGWALYSLPAHRVPLQVAETQAFARLWEREALLARCALLVDYEEAENAGEERRVFSPALADLIERVGAPLVLCSRERCRSRRSLVTYDVERASPGEQRALWQAALNGLNLNGQVDNLSAHFHLGAEAIEEAVAMLGSLPPAATPDEMGDLLWEGCRSQARPRLDDLAQRISTGVTWEDLVLPEGQLQTLRAIAVQVRQRATVYERWGFGAKGARGLGISALFAGPSGTGKTLAAEVLANELRLDLYRIDLSQVVSKYIGETEKNLRRVFDAAEAGGVVLLFDEADALFGKRSEVKDSHDRYANIEVSYLLQCMETYRGLAILTTNMKAALDGAFLRRLRFVVQFPFPDAALRAAIWQRVFPAATPTARLDPQRLARLNVTGGSIRNIALGAAFLAAEAGTAVGMTHIREAAGLEYAKMEKPLSEAEMGGW